MMHLTEKKGVTKNGLRYWLYWGVFVKLPRRFTHRPGSPMPTLLHTLLLRAGFHLHPSVRRPVAKVFWGVIIDRIIKAGLLALVSCMILVEVIKMLHLEVR